MDPIMIVAFVVAAVLTFGGLYIDKHFDDRAPRPTRKWMDSGRR